MAHKTLIGGAAYEISGGRTLVNGTGYSIDKGKTLVGGTAYEVGFAPSEATVTITGTGYYRDPSIIGPPKVSYVTINGAVYSSEDSVIVPIGTVVACTVGSMDPSGNSLPIGSVKVNGVVVATAGEVSNPVTYNYTVNGNVAIKLSTQRNSDKDSNGYIEITEIPEGHAMVQITGTGNSNTSYVTINGTKYYSTNVVAIPVGTVIYCYAISPDEDSDYYGVIRCNGIVAKATNKTGNRYYAEYNYTVNRYVTINLSGTSSYGNITITET